MNAARASFVALMLFMAFAAFADVAVPPLTGRIVDQTATLDSGQIAALDRKLQAFEARTGSQVAVLIVPTTAPETIEQYSIRVADRWKIGRKKIDDGAILLIAKNDRKLRIEVGYGLEGVLTDVTSRRIIDEIITPKFRDGDFSAGIVAGVDRILAVIGGEPLPPPQQKQADRFDPSELLNPFVIVIVVVVGGVLRGVFGRLFGSLATGGVVAVLFWFIAASLLVSAIGGIIAFVITLFADLATSNGGSRRSGWSGGGGSFSGGSSGGGGGGGGGGFSGGGGSFGGGGASGSW